MRLNLLKYSWVTLLLGVSASWGADYLYTPHQVQNSQAEEGVLVREVTVKKGNTLSGLSKKYSGRGYYYPQILLFNQIKNPHRIYPGQVIRVPLGKQQADAKPHQEANEPASSTAAPRTAAVHHPAPKRPETAPANSPAAGQAESDAYAAALATFKQGNCGHAIKQFDEFINRYPHSSLLPEATLNRAECYLKLSSK